MITAVLYLFYLTVTIYTLFNIMSKYRSHRSYKDLFIFTIKLLLFSIGFIIIPPIIAEHLTRFISSIAMIIIILVEIPLWIFFVVKNMLVDYALSLRLLE